MQNQPISLRPLNRFNWETAAALKIHDFQEDYLPPVLHTIAQSKFEDIALNGIFLEDEMVGFVSWGHFGEICWINRILIDKDHQQKGIGTEAIRLVLEKLRKDPKIREIRTSFSRKNAFAEYFFLHAGFVRIADGLADEIVMTYPRA